MHLLYSPLLILLLILLLPINLATSNPPTTPDLSPRKIALLHMHDSAPFFAELGSITLSNKRRYATRHSYELAYHIPFNTQGLWKKTSTKLPCEKTELKRANSCYEKDSAFSIDARAATFGKIKLALAACTGREGYWLLWSDADALIVNQEVELESLIDDRFDIMVSVDWLMINAGVMLFKCSDWTKAFLKRVYAAREFDGANALDQSAFQHFFDTEPGTKEHVKYVPKKSINVYVEEYRAGDFLLHMAGKLYEATTEGAIAIANQFDVLSTVDDLEDVRAFFSGRYLLNMYSGVCMTEGADSACLPEDDRRLKLNQSLGSMSVPDRYRHVGLRYYWMPNWQDKYDTEGWNDGRKKFEPNMEEEGGHLDPHDEL